MPASFADFVEETTKTSGTGDFELEGAKTGRQTFVSGVGDGATVEFAVTNGADWEVAEGTVTSGSPDTLSRDTVIASSNGGNKVNFGSSEKSIFLVSSSRHNEPGSGISLDSSSKFQVDEPNVNHDNLNNFVSNEHIDHSNVSISAGTGLSGGGDITASRTLNLSAATSDLTDAASPNATAAGQLLIWDQTDGQFENVTLTAGSGITVTNADASITVSADEANIDHDALSNFVANEHVDHSTVSISSGAGLSGGGDITASRTLSLDAATGDLNDAASPNATAAGQLLIYDATDSQFENATLTGGSGISVTNADASVTLSADEANIDHDSLQNFVSNEHIDHSGVSISSGTGLSGGGDITASRTISLDAATSDLNDAASPNATAAGQLLIWHGTNSRFENSTLTGGNGINVANADASVTLSIPTDAIQTDELDLSITPTWTGKHTFDAGLNAGSSKITNVAQGSAATDAVNLEQLNSVSAGIDWKKSVRAATDGSNVDLSSATDPNPIDGVTLADGDRVLLKDQTTGSENGIYDAVTATDPTTWVRSSDADEDSEVTGGMTTWIREGTNNGDVAYVLTTDSPTLGTDALSFTAFSTSALTAGDGLSKTGNTLSVSVGDFAGSGLESDGGSPADLRISTGAAGTGLTGGSGSALSLDINGLTSLSASPASADLLAIYDNGAGNHKEISVSELEGGLNHDNLSGFVSNEHIDHSGVSISAGTGLSGGGDITASRTLALDINGLSSLGASPASADKLALYDNGAGSHVEIDISELEGGLNHDNLSGFVSNEHIDHSGVSISAGTGLSGGGDITASRTLSLNAATSDLNDAASPNATAAGQLLIWNATNGQFENATLTGTTNQVNVTNADASVTLSTPQDIDTGALPTFAGGTYTGDVTYQDDSAVLLGTGGDGRLDFDSATGNVIFDYDVNNAGTVSLDFQQNGTSILTLDTSGNVVLGSVTLDATSATVNLPSGAVDAIGELASGIRTGSDTSVVTGTSGASGNLADWDANGDLVDSGLQTANTPQTDTANTYSADQTVNAEHRANHYSSGENTVSDDSVLSIPVPHGAGLAKIVISNSDNDIGEFLVDVGSTAAIAAVSDLNNGFTTTTGSLSGTTGTDGNLTVSADATNTQVDIENRTGASMTVRHHLVN